MTPNLPPIKEMIAFRKGQTDLSDFTDSVTPAPGSDKDLYRKGVDELTKLCDSKFYLDKYNPRHNPITGKDLAEKLENLRKRNEEVSRARQDAYTRYKREHDDSMLLG